MDKKENGEVEDMFDSIGDDLSGAETRDKGRRREKEVTGFRLTASSAVIFGLGLVVVVGLLALLFKGGSKVSVNELESLKTRISQLESRLIRLDGMVSKAGSQDAQLRSLTESVAKLEAADKSLKEQVDRVSQSVDKLAEKPAPTVAKKEFPAPSKKENASPTPQAKGRYHVVQRGETLFRIAKQYGLSLDQLRRMNNLKEKQSIYAGQKLIVALESR